MPKPSPFLVKMQRQAEIKSSVQQDVMKIFTIQQSLDMALLALGREFGFGPSRCKRFIDRFNQIFGDYIDDALTEAKSDDSIIYIRACIDRELKQYCGEHFHPWDERYSNVPGWFWNRGR